MIPFGNTDELAVCRSQLAAAEKRLAEARHGGSVETLRALAAAERRVDVGFHQLCATRVELDESRRQARLLEAKLTEAEAECRRLRGRLADRLLDDLQEAANSTSIIDLSDKLTALDDEIQKHRADKDNVPLAWDNALYLARDRIINGD